MARKIRFDPKVVGAAVDSHPRIREMRGALEQNYGASEAQSRTFAEGLLTAAVMKFGAKYADAISERLAQLFKRRDQARQVVDDVIGPAQMSPEQAGAKLGQLFKEMREDVEALTDPATFAKQSNLKADLDISKDVDNAFREYERRPPRPPSRPLRTGKHEAKTEVLQQRFENQPRDRQQAVRTAADVAPHELWKAVTSETEGEWTRSMDALRAKAESAGMKPDEINKLERAVTGMRAGPVTSRPLQRGFLRYRFRAPDAVWRTFDAMPDGHAVYLVRNAAGDVIYVGVTSRTGWDRWGEHLAEKGGEWLGQAARFEFVAVGLPTEKLALALEHDFMSQLAPPYNKQWTYRSKFGGPPDAVDIPRTNAMIRLLLSHE